MEVHIRNRMAMSSILHCAAVVFLNATLACMTLIEEGYRHSIAGVAYIPDLKVGVFRHALIIYTIMN